jgi:protease-4
MRTLSLLLICAAAATGCRGLTVNTRSAIAMEGPVETTVTADLGPVDRGPVKPTAVPSGESGATDAAIAILDVDGLLVNTPFTGISSLGENPVSLFREKLDAMAADPCVRAVVLRINSPGGGVAAVDLMRNDLLRFRARSGKPVVACLMDVATGGAYYVAAACDRVVAAPATVTGGIGVILNLYNLRDLMAQFNVLPQEIKAGPNVDLGTPARALSPEGKKILQAMADEYHERLKKGIRETRPAVTGDTTFDGRIFTASQASERGLIDAIGDLDQSIELARQVAGTPNATAVLYRRKNDPARSIYAVTPNAPLQLAQFPSVPGLERSRLPTFLSIWQPELTLERLGGK